MVILYHGISLSDLVHNTESPFMAYLYDIENLYAPAHPMTPAVVSDTFKTVIMYNVTYFPLVIFLIPTGGMDVCL